MLERLVPIDPTPVNDATVVTSEPVGPSPVQLTTMYRTATSMALDSITVVTSPAQVAERGAALQAKLAALGIDDITSEGGLVLGGSVAITPGLRRGVAMTPTVNTSASLDLDNVPEFFGYTMPGRPVRTTTMQLADAGLATPDLARRSRSRTRASAARVATGVEAEATVAAGSTLVSAPLGSPIRTVTMSASDVLAVDEALIVAEELQFNDEMVMLIANNVRYLTIIAQRITVGTNTTIMWEPAAAPDRGALPAGENGHSYLRSVETSSSSFNSPDGGDGWSGGNGARGYAGDPAPTVEIWGLDVGALPAVELQGGGGGTGQRGADGGDGGDGAKGEHSHQNVVNCTQGPGYGGDGGDGGYGGDGGDGGTGGRGGSLLLYLTDASHEAALEAGLTVNIAGGRGGDPGDGGDGGDGGLGGEPGDSSWPWCTAEPDRAGADGRDGEDGDDGTEGRIGDTGLLTAVVITADEFRRKWTAPQIRTITPWEVEVGDTVTIEGANYTSASTALFDGVAADTTFIADTILQADLPAVTSGWVEVVVDVAGGELSNPGSVKVLPTLMFVTPSPAVVGKPVTITGSGFDVGCRVLFRGLELDPDSVSSDGTTVVFTPPAPQGPFEEIGGIEPVSVRNSDGVATAPFDLQLRHVVSIGFDVARNAYSFLNASPNGVADAGTFAETYGAADVAANFLVDPVLTGAWYLYYRHFFNTIRPGYSSGFAMTAVEEYWSGNPDLFGDHTTLSDVERLLTVAQGHILSQEMIAELALQAAAGTGRAETSLLEIEAVFRNQILVSDEERRRIAPVMQLIPAGTILTPGFINSLNISHGLLPIRVEFAADGEPWEKRLVVYDNAGNVGLESRLEFTRLSDGSLSFVLQHLDAAGNVSAGDTWNRSTSTGWTLSHVSLEDSWLTDVTMPFDYMFMLSPATMLVEDADGRRFGTAGKRSWNDLPGAVAAVGAEKLYLLPLDKDLTISVQGTGTGTYTLGVVAGSLGRSVTLTDVPVTAETRDTVEVVNGMREVRLRSQDTGKALTMHYGLDGGPTIRALALEGLTVGAKGTVTFRANDDLSEFELDDEQPSHKVSVRLSAIGADDARRERFDRVNVGAGAVRRFTVDSWKALGPSSLRQS